MNRRVFSMLLVLCFVLSCINTTAFADVELQASSYTVNGPDVVLKPYNSEYSKVHYELLDESGAKVDAKWSASGGLCISKSGYVPLYAALKDGSYTLTAEYENVQYQKSITVRAGLGNNFSSAVVGSEQQTDRSEYADDGDGNIYIKPYSGKFYYLDPGAGAKDVREQIVFQSDIRTTKTSFDNIIGLVHNSSNEWSGGISLKAAENDTYTARFEDYTNYDTTTYTGQKTIDKTTDIPAGSWVTMKMEMLYHGAENDVTFNIYLNDTLIFENVKNRCIGYKRANNAGFITDCTGIFKMYGYGQVANWAIYSGEKFDPAVEPYYGLTITGGSEYGLPRTAAPITANYVLTNFLGADITASWEISPSDAGVAITDDGTLSISRNATPQNYTIKAVCGNEYAVYDIVVKQVNYVLTISGANKILLDQKQPSQSFSYTVADQFGISEEVSWSMPNGDTYISIDETTGVLTVFPGAATGEYKIIATPIDTESVLSAVEKTVQVEELTYAIVGDTSVLKPAFFGISALQYVLADNNGVRASNVEWSCDGAEILQDGRLLLTKATPSSLIVSAVCDGKQYDYPVSVKTGFYEQFESKEVGSIWAENTNVNGQSIVQQDSSNLFNPTKYCYAQADKDRVYCSTHIGDVTNADVHLDYDCFAMPGEKFTGTIFVQSNSDWTNTISYACSSSGGQWNYTFSCDDYDKEDNVTKHSRTISLPQNAWASVSYVIHTATSTFDVYVNGTEVAKDAGIRYNGSRPFGFGQTIFVGRIDNIKSYSGTIYDRTISYVGTNTMPVFDSGISEKALNCQVLDEGIENFSGKVEWSIVRFGDEDLSDSVYISDNKLCTKSPVYGTVYVVGTESVSGIATPEIPITLVKAYSTFQNNILTAFGAPNENYTVKIYKPNSTNYVDAMLGYDNNNFETVNMVADETGNASKAITFSNDGMYYITIENAAGVVEDYISINGENKLFEQTNLSSLFSTNNFEYYLSAYTTEDGTLIKKCTQIYNEFSATQKEIAVSFCEKDIQNYYAAVLLTDVLSGNQTELEACDAALEKLGYDTTIVNLMVANKAFAEIAATVLQTADTFDSALQKIADQVILIGVTESDIYYKNAKPYLAQLGCTKYNSATDEQKNMIAKEVAGKIYASIADLVKAINMVDITISTGTVSGGSGGGKKLSSGSVNMPADDTNKNENQQITLLFTDVPESYWGYECINKMANQDIINGYGKQFQPDNSITRAEFVKILVKAFKLELSTTNDFSDVNEKDWFMPYVAAAYKAGLVNGSNGNFNPEEFITRQDAATMLYRFASYIGMQLSGENANFTDINAVSDYAQKAVYALSANGIINGMGDGSFAPLGATSRAAATKLIYEIIQKGGAAQ